MKILVNIYVPAISLKYDILIPSELRIRNVVPLIAKTVEELSNYVYVMSGVECLCSVERQIVLRPGYTLESYGIENGDHLIMM